MPRGKGPLRPPPDGQAAWTTLNSHIYGDVTLGGAHRPPESDARPLDWPAIFGREAPLHLEIGFNRGKFINELARSQPDADFVGIEIRKRFAWVVAWEMAEADGPRNLRVVWGDARKVTPTAFADGTVEGVYINFPDPWWKNRHAKRRLVDLKFAEELCRILRPGGRVHVKSDVPAIAQEIQEALEAVPALQGPTPMAEDALPFTFREVKCVAQGMPITRYTFQRTASPASSDTATE